MSRTIDAAQAEGIAIQTLAFLANDPELLPRFLALTGIEASQVRQAAGEPGFLAGVLAFFLAHEPSLLALCADTGLRPQEVADAARILPSGDDNYERST